VCDENIIQFGGPEFRLFALELLHGNAFTECHIEVGSFLRPRNPEKDAASPALPKARSRCSDSRCGVAQASNCNASALQMHSIVSEQLVPGVPLALAPGDLHEAVVYAR
jgi:hypothetical protein